MVANGNWLYNKNQQAATKCALVRVGTCKGTYVYVWGQYTLTTHTHAMEANPVYTNTDGDTFSATDCGMQHPQYDEMDMADQPQKKLNNTVRHPFPISQSVLLFFFLTQRPPTQLHLPWFNHYHPFSFLCSSSQLSSPAEFSSSFLFSLRSSFLSLPPLPFGFRLKTHTQTDSGTERQPGSDLGSEL